jgi:hypothetical protein
VDGWSDVALGLVFCSIGKIAMVLSYLFYPHYLTYSKFIYSQDGLASKESRKNNLSNLRRLTNVIENEETFFVETLEAVGEFCHNG